MNIGGDGAAASKKDSCGTLASPSGSVFGVEALPSDLGLAAGAGRSTGLGGGTTTGN